MGFMDGIKANQLGGRAYRTHVAALQLRQQGKYRECTEKLNEAYRLYGEAYEMGFRKSGALTGYGILSMQIGDFEKARALMLEAAKDKAMKPDDRFTLRVNFAICQWKMGHVDKAIETIRMAAQHKMNGLVYTTLGMFLVDQARQTGDFAEAIEFNRQAMEYDDEDPATLDNVAQMNLFLSERESDSAEKQSLRDTAKRYFKRAHELKPDQVTTIYYLARMEEEDGNVAGALSLVREGLSMPITSVCPVTRPEMEEYEKKLEKMQ